METLAVEEAFIEELEAYYGYTEEEAKKQWLEWGDRIIDRMWDDFSNSLEYYIEDKSGEQDG